MLKQNILTKINFLKSKIRIGNTWFNIESEGNGTKLIEFKIDGKDEIKTGGVLNKKYIDGKHHKIIVKMK